MTSFSSRDITKNIHDLHTSPTLPLPHFGAYPLSNGLTCFRLWAPNASNDVILEIQGHAPITMTPLEEGYYEAQVPCEAYAHYCYRITPTLCVPDPASRLQAGDVHDASIVQPPNTYAWRHPNWCGRPWHETIFYEVHPGLAGGYAGIEQRLPELAQLGITAIELMPIADFPGPHNWGYDGVLPYAPDCSYGTPNELKHLIDTAHGLGMMVFLDVVYNHFGPEGNYLPIYAVDFFHHDTHTPWGAAINFQRRQVRQFFSENALYWLTEYRFDGLRLDAAQAINDPGWLREMARFVRAYLPADRHVHLVLENDNNQAQLLEHDFQAQWNDDGHHSLHYLLTHEREGYYEEYVPHATQKLIRCLTQGFIFQGEASSYRHGKPRGEPSAYLPPTAFILFLQNHDQIGNRPLGERLTFLLRHNPRLLRAAVALLLLTPQIPLIFMGEERGATTPFFYFTSHTNTTLVQAVRDGRRREFEAFYHTTAKNLWDQSPDPNDSNAFKRSNPYEAPPDKTWIAYYRALLHCRQQLIVPHLKGAHALGAHMLGAKALLAQWRLDQGAILSLYLNLGSVNLEPDWLKYPACEGQCIFESEPNASKAIQNGHLPHAVTVAFLKESL